MKTRKKFWLRGDVVNGKKVIAALEHFGGINSLGLHGSNPTKIYFINHNNKIDYYSKSSEVGKIIMDEYEELDDIESLRFKCGNYLVDNLNREHWMILKDYDLNRMLVRSFLEHGSNGYFSNYDKRRGPFLIDKWHLATQEEIVRIDRQMIMAGYKFDKENKVLYKI